MIVLEPLSGGPVTRQAQARLIVQTSGPGFVEVTAQTVRWLAGAGIERGLLTLFCRHTSASLAVQENADPSVRADLDAALDRLAPRDVPYRHHAEGPDDMPAHIRAMLTGAQLSVPIQGGRPVLGTWQGLYLVEHRDRPHRREVILCALGA